MLSTIYLFNFSFTMKYLHFLFPICLFLQTACDKEPPPVPIDPNEPKKDSLPANVVWAKGIMQDTSEVVVGFVKTTATQVIYVQYGKQGDKAVMARNLKTGASNWTWGDPKVLGGGQITALEIEGDKLVVQSWQDLFVLDINTGQTIWHADVRPQGDCAYPRTSVINGLIYYVTNDCEKGRVFCRLWRTPISVFQPQEVFLLNAETPIRGDSGWHYSIGSPALWLHPERGDSVLIFQTRAFKGNALANKADLYAFSLKDKNLLWKVDSIAQEGYSSVHVPIISGNDIYHIGHFSVQKVDALTGKVLWSSQFLDPSELFSFTGITLGSNGKIYAYPGSDYLYALDAQTGKLVWKADLECCGVTGNIHLANNKLYFIAPPNFYTVNAETGATLDKFPSGLKRGNYKTEFKQFATAVPVPGVPNQMIAFDSYYIMALTLKP